MKLKNVKAARAIWLFQTEELNPRGGQMLPVVEALVARYSFVKFPSVQELLAQKSHKFENGTFKGSDKSMKSVDLTVHDDGLVIDTRSSTGDGDLFAADVLTWVAKEFGLPHYGELNIRRAYASEMVVQFEREVSIFNDRFAKFAGLLSGDGGREKQASFMLSHLNFSTDYASSRPQGLRIEREANVPFSHNSYYSAAQVSTDDHLKILKEFEAAACQ